MYNNCIFVQFASHLKKTYLTFVLSFSDQQTNGGEWRRRLGYQEPSQLFT